MRDMDFKDYRRAARSTMTTERATNVTSLLRPRFIFGLCRQRPPLAWQLWVAGRNGRLVWRSPDAFCLLDPPVPTPPKTGRLATWTADNWPITIMTGATAALMACGAAVAFLVPRSELSVLTAVTMVIGALVGFVGAWIVQLARSAVELARSFGERRHLVQIIADHWSVRLLHAADPKDVPALIELATAVTGGAVLLAELRRVTTNSAATALCDQPKVHSVGLEVPAVVAIGANARLTKPGSRRVSMARGLPLLALTVLIGLVFTADLIADSERLACTPNCTDRPADLANALYWLVSHMLPFEPDGIEAKTWPSRLLGICWTLFGLLVVGTGVNLLFQNAVSRNKSAGVDIVARFNSDREAAEQPGSAAAEQVPRDQARSLPPAVWFATGVAAGLLVRRGSAGRRVSDRDLR